jgi:uncharacterized protein YyaL (SSP411 family)
MNLILLAKILLRDLLALRGEVRALDDHLRAAMDWLCTAQDANGDGGVALRYSLVRGWENSYPETTGYIIPTFLEFASCTGDDVYRQRALRMADWELSIQGDDGGYHGGPIGSGLGKLAFDTGQVLRGLVEIYRASEEERYLQGAIRAGDWLISSQDDGGMWIRHAYHSIPHVYYARVAWALAELGKLADREVYRRGAARNVTWVLTRQRDNGWFDDCGFTETGHAAPYTHTIAYTVRGVLEVGACLGREDFLEAAVRSADAMLRARRADGSLAGKYDENWQPVGKYSCLTGDAQTAIIFWRLHELTGHRRFRDAAAAMNTRLCERQALRGPREVRGAMGGSHPAWGDYERFAFPNWATKFLADALLIQKKAGI